MTDHSPGGLEPGTLRYPLIDPEVVLKITADRAFLCGFDIHHLALRLEAPTSGGAPELLLEAAFKWLSSDCG